MIGLIVKGVGVCILHLKSAFKKRDFAVRRQERFFSHLETARKPGLPSQLALFGDTLCFIYLANLQIC
jgi:hypothetical protein